MTNEYWVYIMSSYQGTIYTGVTNDLERRVAEHKGGLLKGFTSKYKVHQLVYFEQTSDVHSALPREKQIKGWTRAKKVALVSATNPSWRDLSLDWQGPSLRSG